MDGVDSGASGTSSSRAVTAIVAAFTPERDSLTPQSCGASGSTMGSIARPYSMWRLLWWEEFWRAVCPVCHNPFAFAQPAVYSARLKRVLVDVTVMGTPVGPTCTDHNWAPAPGRVTQYMLKEGFQEPKAATGGLSCHLRKLVTNIRKSPPVGPHGACFAPMGAPCGSKRTRSHSSLSWSRLTRFRAAFAAFCSPAAHESS